MTINSLPNNKILDWSKFKAFADDKKILANIFSFHNIFFLYSIPNERIIDWTQLRAVNKFVDNKLTIYNTILTFNNPEKKPSGIENLVGKGENTGEQHFLLSPQYF